MKLSIGISNYISEVATNVFPIGKITVRGIMVCTIAGRFFASLQLTNNCVEPVSSIADITNPWILIGKYKRLYCILILLNSGWPTFPTYLMSTGYISIPVLSPGSCLGYSALPSYYWDIASCPLFTYCTRTYMVDPDNF